VLVPRIELVIRILIAPSHNMNTRLGIKHGMTRDSEDRRGRYGLMQVPVATNLPLVVLVAVNGGDDTQQMPRLTGCR